MGKQKNGNDDEPRSNLTEEVGDELLKRVKETAKKINERIKKATEETGETAKAETDEHTPLDDKKGPGRSSS